MYSYKDSVTSDVISVIQWDYPDEYKAICAGNFSAAQLEDFEEALNDELWADDRVTGNQQGWYIVSDEMARQCIREDLDLVAEACYEFEVTDAMKKYICEPSYLDVTARCYILGQAIQAALETISATEY